MFNKLKNKFSLRSRGNAKGRLPKYAPNSYSHLRKKTIEKRRFERFRNIEFKKPSININRSRKKLLVSLIFIPLIVIISILTVFVVLKTDIFIVKDFYFEHEDEESVDEIKNKYIGKNIFSFNKSSVEKDVRSTFEYVTDVFIRKEYPDKVYVEVVQDQPAYSVYLIDALAFVQPEDSEKEELVNKNLVLNDEGFVIESNEYSPIVSFTPFEIIALLGEEDLESEEVRGVYKSRLETEEELENFKWEEVEDKEKRAIFNELSANADLKLRELYEAHSMEEGALDKFIQINARETLLGDFADRLGKYQFTLDIMSELREREVKFNVPIWISSATLRIDFLDGKRLYFSPGRPFEDQIRDLKVVFDNNIINSRKIFDLRTTNFSRSD